MKNLSASVEIEPRCSFCFLPVKNFGDEHCSDNCRELERDYDEGVTVYRTEDAQ